MSFSRLMIDTVSLFKKNGENINEIEASVQSDKIFIMRNDMLNEGMGSIPAGYQMQVKKMGIPEAEKAIQKITYNISGPNARVNNNSTDNSINTVTINSDVAEHLSALRVEIEKLALSNEEIASAIEIVDAIETQFKAENPSKTVVSTLLKALPSAGSIATIGSFLLSCFGG